MKKPVKKMGGGMMSPRKAMAMGMKHGGVAHSKKK